MPTNCGSPVSDCHLIATGPSLDITDVRFRMLIVLGNRRQQVRMAGNAVTPPAARDLVAVVADTLRTAM